MIEELLVLQCHTHLLYKRKGIRGAGVASTVDLSVVLDMLSSVIITLALAAAAVSAQETTTNVSQAFNAAKLVPDGTRMPKL